MDEMRLVSTFTTKIVSKVIGMVIRKKLGYDIDLQLNEVQVTITDGKANIHLDANAEINQDELNKILRSIGI